MFHLIPPIVKNQSINNSSIAVFIKSG